MSIYWMVTLVMVLNGVVLWGLTVLCRSALMKRHRTRKDWPRRVPEKEHRQNTVINSAVSTAQVFGACFLLKPWLISEGTPQAWEVVLETGMVLLLYDFGYYLLHRFVFHQWSVGRRWHGVHHRVRSPFVGDSIYIHPVETVLGLSLFLLCVGVVGPISVTSFGVAFFVYSAWNLFIHSAFHLPFFPFRGMSALVTHHDRHHDSMRSGYYASLTPIFDWLFGTATTRMP